jgi:hypothetical protein
VELETEIERLRGYEIAARDLSADLTKVAGDRDEQAAKIRELEDARPKCDHEWQAAIEERGYQTCLKCGECRNLQYGGRT